MRWFTLPIGLFLIGIALIVAIVWSSYAPGRATSGNTKPTPRQQTFEQMLETGTDAIYIDNQPSGATDITVGFAVMKDAGFVVVFDDGGGIPGRAIGQSPLLPAGGGEHVSVALEEPLSAGEVYYAMLYRDDGDGAFDPAKDRQATNAEGNVALMTFVAKEDAVPEDAPVLP